jgi:hypothetical protein
VTSSAAALLDLADSIPAEQLAKHLSAGQLNGAIEALSNSGTKRDRVEASPA